MENWPIDPLNIALISVSILCALIALIIFFTTQPEGKHIIKKIRDLFNG